MSFKVGFIGSGGDFSLLPFQYLLSSKHKLAMVGVDGIIPQLNCDPRLRIVQHQGQNVRSLAQQTGIPLLDLRQHPDQIISQLRDFQLDLVIVACYNKKIPESFLALPRFGFLNIHPSLLPAYRGPAPLFWQFRKGRSEYGISLHKMDSEFDTGPIVAQHSISFADGISHNQANRQLGKLSCELLVNYFTALENNTVSEKFQQKSKAGYMSFPKEKDFVINNQWSARRIYNFICATRHWGRAYPCQVDSRTFQLKDVISYDNGENGELNSNYKVEEQTIIIKCRPGILKARLDMV